MLRLGFLERRFAVVDLPESAAPDISMRRVCGRGRDMFRGLVG